MRQIHTFLFAFLMAFLWYGCEGDSSTNGSSNGELVDITISALFQNAPLGNAFVTIFASPISEGAIAFGSTDATGECVLSDIETGTYTIEVCKSMEGWLIYGMEFTSLSASNLSVTLNVEETDDDYFPLALNNYWTFSDMADSVMTVGIYTTKSINGVTTYTFGPEESYPPFMTHTRTSVYWHGWETIDGVDHILPFPVVFIDVSGSIGETWVIPDWGSVQLVALDVDVIVPAGNFTGCMVFEFNAEAAIGEMTLAPGIGPVLMEDEFGVLWELVDYDLY